MGGAQQPALCQTFHRILTDGCLNLSLSALTPWDLTQTAGSLCILNTSLPYPYPPFFHPQSLQCSVLHQLMTKWITLMSHALLCPVAPVIYLSNYLPRDEIPLGGDYPEPSLHNT